MTPSRRPSRALGARAAFAARRAALVAALALALCSLAPIGGAEAAETAALEVGFSPYRLGVNSAFKFTIHVGTTAGGLPPAATSIALRLPAGMGLSSSQLGLSVCRRRALQVGGVAGCPAEAVMGSGEALMMDVEGSEELEVPAAVTVLMAPSSHEKTRLFFYAEGEATVLAELLFAGYMIGVNHPLSTLIGMTVPPVVGVPGTPAAALVDMAVTLAPPALTYEKRVGGRTVRYHPKGLSVPTVCPSGGFPFSVRLGFADGGSAEASTRLPCPAAASKGTSEHGARGRRVKHRRGTRK